MKAFDTVKVQSGGEHLYMTERHTDACTSKGARVESQMEHIQAEGQASPSQPSQPSHSAAQEWDLGGQTQRPHNDESCTTGQYSASEIAHGVYMHPG